MPAHVPHQVHRPVAQRVVAVAQPGVHPGHQLPHARQREAGEVVRAAPQLRLDRGVVTLAHAPEPEQGLQQS